MAWEWPEKYTDPDTGQTHDWDDPFPDEDGNLDPEYTYRDWIEDQAEAQGLSVEEFAEYSSFDRPFDDDVRDEDIPPWMSRAEFLGDGVE